MIAMKSHDPDKVPELDEEAFAEADRLGLHPVYIICDEPGANAVTPQEFHSSASLISPRVGERLDLEDGTKCEVKRPLRPHQNGG